MLLCSCKVLLLKRKEEIFMAGLFIVRSEVLESLERCLMIEVILYE